MATVVSGSQSANNSEIEQSITYERSDGMHIEMVVAILDDGPCVGGIGAYTDVDLARGEPTQCIDLSREELRYLRSLLNRPEVVAMLEEE